MRRDEHWCVCVCVCVCDEAVDVAITMIGIDKVSPQGLFLYLVILI